MSGQAEGSRLSAPVLRADESSAGGCKPEESAMGCGGRGAVGHSVMQCLRCVSRVG